MERSGRQILLRAAATGALSGLVGAAAASALWLAQPGPVGAERAAFAAWVDSLESGVAAEAPDVLVARTEARPR